MSSRRVLRRCGVIADVQYADVEDGSDYLKTVVRRFRGAKQSMECGCALWKSLAAGAPATESYPHALPAAPVTAVLQLGDFIDGRNHAAGASHAALADLERVVAAGPCAPGAWLHLIGNHELYNFTRDELAARLRTRPPATLPASADVVAAAAEGIRAVATLGPEVQWPAPGAVCGTGREFYATRLATGWWAVVLDPYEVSTIAPSVPRGDGIDAVAAAKAAAIELVQAHNPNDVLGAANWKAGLTGLDLRWLPYNGAVGKTQLTWLTATLSAIQSLPPVPVDGEGGTRPHRAVVLCHVGLKPGSLSDDCLLWNYDDVLTALQPFLGNTVALVLQGHDHPGGAVAPGASVSGAPFVTFPSPMEVDKDDDAFGTLDLRDDGSAVVYGHGSPKAWRNALPGTRMLVVEPLTSKP